MGWSADKTMGEGNCYGNKHTQIWWLMESEWNWNVSNQG